MSVQLGKARQETAATIAAVIADLIADDLAGVTAATGAGLAGASQIARRS